MLEFLPIYSEKKRFSINGWRKTEKSQKGMSAAVSLGELVNVDWKAGVSVASSHTRALNEPFVALQLSIRQADGKLLSRHVHLTLSEFQAVSAGLNEAQSAMTRL